MRQAFWLALNHPLDVNKPMSPGRSKVWNMVWHSYMDWAAEQHISV